jgi:YYY domain-containing protein
MTAFISWYILITILGWITFPLAFRLFPALVDRGYTLSRAFGLMIWGFVFWLFAMLGIAQNDLGGLLLSLTVLAGLSTWALVNTQSEIVNRKSEITGWLKENIRLILTTELLFLLAFGFMAFFRSTNPEILGTEKPMELMFINGIMNSPAFPPRDLWLSGYSISYYYFGYVMTAMLAKFTGVPATMAFNLMLALVFGLAAVGAYGVLYNLLTISRRSNAEGQKSIENSKSVIVNSLLAPLFLLLVSNVEGFLEILHARGLFWRDGSNFWTWLDIPELRNAPPQISQWAPDRFWWWWRASRVVQDYDLNGTFREAIDEFPAFSFLLGDLHPHVLSIPFFLLAISFALNLFLGGFRGRINLYVGELHISKTGFLLAAFLLGGMAFLNTWDILPVAAVIVFSYALARVQESGWGWGRLEDVLLFGIPAIVTAYVLYLPFFLGFDSQAGGIVPNFMYVTRGAHLWVMWGTLFVPIFALMLHFARTKLPADWGRGIAASLGILVLLLATMLAMGFLAYRLRPELVLPILQGQGRDASTFLADSFTRRLNHIGSLLTLLALLIPALSFLFSNRKQPANESTFQSSLSTFHSPLPTFVLFLIVLGALLILGPDFLYLQDNFGYRINTVFKFYYQAWILLSLAAAYGTAVLLHAERRTKSEVEASRGVSNVLFSVIFVLLLVVGLTYPVLAFPAKANNFQPPFGFTLDDFVRVQRENPDEAAAILWLRSAPDGVIAEATGNPYSSVGRISIYSGLPTILGWGNHEGQWRGSDFQGILLQRKDDVETLYTTPDWQTMQTILESYDVRYVIVGNLERSSYRVNEEKFNNYLRPVFQQGNITIYEVP